jgi:hypothetical protein
MRRRLTNPSTRRHRLLNGNGTPRFVFSSEGLTDWREKRLTGLAFEERVQEAAEA